MSCDILIYVEDPGAANFVIDLPYRLNKENISYVLLASNHAVAYLKNKKVVPTEPGTESAENLLKIYRPKILLVGTSENPNSLGLQLIQCARSLSIISMGIVDACCNAAYRFRGNANHPLYYVPNFLIVADDATNNAFVELGFPLANIFVSGNPYYDKIREQRKAGIEVNSKQSRHTLFPIFPDDERSIVTFCSEVSTGLNPAQYQSSSEYTLKGWRKSKGRTQIVLEELIDSLEEISPRPYFVVRMHPKNDLEEFQDYKPYIDYLSFKENAHEVLLASDVVVGMTSSIMYESYLLGKKTFSIVPKESENNWLDKNYSNEIPCVTSSVKIRKILKDYLLFDLKLPFNVNHGGLLLALDRILLSINGILR